MPSQCIWSGGMIFALGVRGFEFDSGNSPCNSTSSLRLNVILSFSFELMNPYYNMKMLNKAYKPMFESNHIIYFRNSFDLIYRPIIMKVFDHTN